jgi:hypothetical protein
MLVMASCGGSSSSSTTSTTPASNNSTALVVNSGPANNYINGVYTTVTICAPGSSNCQTVDNVLVDTGSVGLRILASAFTTIQQTSLGSIKDSTGDQLQECIQYGDTSYSWGPMWGADVEIAGEKASSVAIQVIGGNTGNPTFANVPTQCLATPVNPNLPNGGNEDTVDSFGANGIIGVGPYPYDCGSGCTSGSSTSEAGYPYYVCPTGQACAPTSVPAQYQAINPVAFFSSSDNNGVVITLGSVPAQGAASASGMMYFGVGTQSDNTLTGATLYAVDENELIPTVTYGGLSYTYLNVLDTGSSTLSVSDSSTLGIPECADDPPLYCPSSTTTLSNISVAGYGGVGSGTTSLTIANADQLFSANPTFAVFSNLGQSTGTGPATDWFDFGLPFILGKTIYSGIAGTTVPNGATAPNGWYGF